MFVSAWTVRGHRVILSDGAQAEEACGHNHAARSTQGPMLLAVPMRMR